MFRKDAVPLSLKHEENAVAGRDFWRSLDELSQTEEFQEYVRTEFEVRAEEWGNLSRRKFLTLMGASLALAGVSGCGQQPREKIIPYVDQPEQITPGKSLYFTTAMTTGGIATGLLVESYMGRPIKIEGNPRHPGVPGTKWSGESEIAPGVSDIFAQAEVLSLYDPDRSQTVTQAGQVSTWDAFMTWLGSELSQRKDSQGRGIRLLTETVTSPTLAAQLQQFQEKYPAARWHQFEPQNQDNVWEGSRLAFGEAVSPQYHIGKADVIVSLDADFLINGPDHLRHAYEFAERREFRDGSNQQKMNRLYVLESSPTLTGAKADHRLALRPDQLKNFAYALASKLGVMGTPPESSDLPKNSKKWLSAIANDVQSGDGGRSLILAGPTAPPIVHALVHAMNDALGNVGETVSYLEPVEAKPESQIESLEGLVEDMNAGEVELLCILGGNPVYNSPSDLGLEEALTHVPLRVHMGLFNDETAARCQWHVPQCHFLESWGDARAADGTVSIIQPLIAPLYEGRTQQEVLALLLGEPRNSYNVVKEYWRTRIPHAKDDEPESFNDRWELALHNGVIPRTERPSKTVTLTDVSQWQHRTTDSGEHRNDNTVDVVFRLDSTVGDGRYANNGWLQELPKPHSKLTWDNAALIAPAYGKRMQLKNGDVVSLRHHDIELQVPVWIIPGHPERSVTLHLGNGRTHAGRVGNAAGFDTYKLQSKDSPWHLSNVELKLTGRRVNLAATQHHHLMQGRDLVKQGMLAEYESSPTEPEFMKHEEHGEVTTLFPPGEHPYDGYKWGMSIDLNRCIGCNACMVACQSENNIPVVGKEQVAVGREMHWIRIDSYYQGEPDDPLTVHQPVPCMHCENAPCELVCPVGATVHSDEGLNQMVYNRCVGTRYCSNNCPYKVRRFNFLQFSDLETPSLALLNNPDVTVRNRGVMEKCTYCVQRITAGRITAEKEDRKIRDGEVVTACQASCPAQAITFGDLNDENSRVSQLQEDPLNYSLLGQLNTRPRTTYLAAMRNPNPLLEDHNTKASD